MHPTHILHEAVSTIAPIVGNTEGNPNDLSTWPISFAQNATPEQRTAAIVFVAAFDMTKALATITKREKIAAMFHAKVAAGVPHRGKIIQIDDTSRSNINSMALLAKLVNDNTPGVSWPADMANIGWRTRDNSYLPMTAPQMVTMALTAAGHFMMLRYRFGALKDAVAAAQSAKAIEAIDETSVWGD